MLAAVIGIGSNSVRALVARNNEGVFERLYRDREGTRLFAGLDSRGVLKEESILKTAEAVRRMAAAVREKGAEDLSIFATSAARDAANGQDFLNAIERAAGIPPMILTGEEEARLSFFGASRAVKDECFCGVIDIGGGSTEIVAGRGEDIEEGHGAGAESGLGDPGKEAGGTGRIPPAGNMDRYRRYLYNHGGHGEGDPVDSPYAYARDPGYGG